MTTSTTTPTPPARPVGQSGGGRRLARFFASPESWLLLRLISAAREPVPSKVLVMKSDIPRTACYAILSELRGRGLIEGDRDGWRIARRATKLVARMADLSATGGPTHDA